MNRPELQRLTEERLTDAKALLDAERWSGGYYMAGYAVECALKACVLRYIEEQMEVIFGVRRYVDDCWTHDLAKLAERAGLKDELERVSIDNSELEAYRPKGTVPCERLPRGARPAAK